MRPALRAVAWSAFPGLMAGRARRRERRRRARLGVVDVAARFVDRHGTVVLAGPLAGLRYPSGELEEVDCPVGKLLGTYEDELQPAIREALRRSPATFVDLGCADGYYAVGFARASPGTVVHAFDLARSARSACRKLAEANGVAPRVRLHGKATGASLRRLELGGSVVLCDCEGAEMEIFDEGTVARLSTALVLVELHERARPGVEQALRARFEPTHRCEVVSARPRDHHGHDELAELSIADRELALNEMRGDGLRWAIFSPTTTPARRE